MDGKQLLILLNPKSGSGKGRELFQKQVIPVLKDAEIQYDLQVTTHSNFARNLIRSRQDLLDRYYGIIVASGDGLFYEVINGIMERPDWQRISDQLPIGIIPCGSGNGLAKTIAHLYNEPYEPKPIMNSALTCVSGVNSPMDIVRIQIAKGDKYTEVYSFLSIGWGLIADVDIESERLRSIGAQRFTLWSILRLITMRTYKGKLSYMPWKKIDDDVFNKPTTSRSELPKNPESSDKKLPPEDGDTAQGNANNVGEDEFDDAISFRSHIDSWHSTTSRRTAYYSIAGHSMRSQRSVTASALNRIEAANLELERSAPPSFVPPVNMPLPADGWHHEEGEYVMVHTASTSHISADCMLSPNSRLDDGIIYMIIIRAGVRRSQLLQFLLGLNTGTQFPTEPNEYIRVVPVQAFRIEPDGKEGIITVDGERVEYGPIQGEILSGIINVMVPNAKNRE